MNPRAATLAILVAIVWGLCFVLIQAALPSPAPLLLAALRALLGGGVLGAWIALRRWRPRTRRTDDGRVAANPRSSGLPSIPVLIALALTNAVLALGAMYLAAGRAEAAVASILAGGQPLVLAGAGWALFGERASVRTLTGLGVAMAGVVLVATTSSGATSAAGIALALLAAAAPAAGTVLMRRLAPTVDVVLTTCAQFLVGGTILAGASAVLEPWGALHWSLATVVSLLILGVAGTGLAYVGWFWLVDRVSFVRLGSALFLVPVTGVVAAIVTGARPAPLELVGIAVVLIGIAIASLASTSESAGRPNAQTA